MRIAATTVPVANAIIAKTINCRRVKKRWRKAMRRALRTLEMVLRTVATEILRASAISSTVIPFS